MQRNYTLKWLLCGWLSFWYEEVFYVLECQLYNLIERTPVDSRDVHSSIKHYAYRVPKKNIMSCLQLYHHITANINLYTSEKLYPHYGDVIMSTLASQITSLAIVCSTVYSGAGQRKYQSSASLAFVWVNNAENVSIWWRHHAHSAHAYRRHASVMPSHCHHTTLYHIKIKCGQTCLQLSMTSPYSHIFMEK